MNQNFFNIIVLTWIALAILIFPVLIRIRAPYGRHSSPNWGPLVSNKWGWVFMELPSLLLFMVLVLIGPIQKVSSVWIFFSVWVLHYTNRIFIFPFLIHTSGKKMPLMILFLAMFFNLMNGFINGYWLGFINQYPSEWLKDPRMIFGLILFIMGFFINQHSDHTLINLRSGGKKGYFIPKGGLFEWVSCPNFFGEILEWIGFAVMTWSLPGLSFAVWTAANLIPRALHHHAWYKTTFSDYPTSRKAVLPWLL